MLSFRIRSTEFDRYPYLDFRESILIFCLLWSVFCFRELVRGEVDRLRTEVPDAVLYFLSTWRKLARVIPSVMFLEPAAGTPLPFLRLTDPILAAVVA
jgi:hypothetical protein